MLSIERQVAEGRLVCPATRQRLVAGERQLTTEDGSRAYALADGVPMLIADRDQDAYLGEVGGAMQEEYAAKGRVSRLQQRFDNWINSGRLRAPAAEAAVHRVVRDQPADALVISVGGGPSRWAGEVNVTIDRFPNVDVVADAYALPYADGSVDSAMCWAVLEHLEFPDKAVAELARVVKPGGLVLCCTPFLQAFHAYPNHFQNLTLIGQRRMLERAGLEIEDVGGIGSTFALIDLASVYLRSFLPGRILPGLLARLLRLLTIVAAPLDRRLGRRADAHVVASNVYALARKP